MDIMIYFPLVFFGILFSRNYKKKGIDIYGYLLLIYTFSAFFSIFVDSLNLYKEYDIFKHPLGIVAPLFYCVLIAICLAPYKVFNSGIIKKIQIVNISRYNKVVYASFLLFVLMILVSVSRIQDIFVAQSLASVRDGFYHGDAEFVWSGYSGWFRYFIGIASLLSSSSYILILFFFYNITILQKPFWFNIITLLGSFTPLIQSVFIADRSGFIHWTLVFVMSFVLFYKMMLPRARKQFVCVGAFLFSMVLLYFVSVTISRFGDDVGGDQSDVFASLVYYSGSSYIQFCNFFNTLSYDAPFSLAPLFPLTYWLCGWPGYFEQCLLVEQVYHHGVSNFSTFLGMILSMSGRVVMCLFVLIYYFISMGVVRRNQLSFLTVKKMIYFFIIVLILNNGLFGYFYMSYSSTCNIIIWIFLAKYLSKDNGKMSIRIIS